MILGCGYRVDGEKNGCILQYTAEAPGGPWQYRGIIAKGDFRHGRVWECPALAQVTPQHPHQDALTRLSAPLASEHVAHRTLLRQGRPGGPACSQLHASDTHGKEHSSCSVILYGFNIRQGLKPGLIKPSVRRLGLGACSLASSSGCILGRTLSDASLHDATR